MNRVIPNDIIDEIRHRSNIVDVISAYIPLKRSGTGVFKGLCPFHNEKTPSFTVNENKQVFHCFGCGKGGDVFKFVMEQENVDFPNAIHLLADKCGVIIPENNNLSKAEYTKVANKKVRLYSLMEEYRKFFCRSLYIPQNSHALSYLYNRGITDDIIKEFQIGYAPDEWNACIKFARALNYTNDEMIETGTVRLNVEKQKMYDHFKGRLTFAIWDEKGKVVGFSARTLDPDAKVAKYVNTPETALFKKSHLLYALPFARAYIGKSNMAILCEGQLDTIALHRAGFKCAVAPQGTAFTSEQARILKRYTNKILLGFDSDNAGQKAIIRAIELLIPFGFDIKVVKFPGGKDPDELYKNSGSEPIENAVNNAIDWVDFFFEYQKLEYDFSNGNSLSLVVKNFVNLIRNSDNEVSKEIYLRQASKITNLSFESIVSELQKAQRQNFRRDNSLAAKVDIKSEKAKNNFLKSELTLLEIVINFENAARHLLDVLPKNYLSKSIVAKAINSVLDDVLADEYVNATPHIYDIIRDFDVPEINNIIAKDSVYKEENINKIIDDCINDLKLQAEKRSNSQLVEELKNHKNNNLSFEERMKVLAKIMEKK